jgi:hypothetical protein
MACREKAPLNRKLAVKVIEEVVNAIKDSTEVGGYEIRPRRRRSTDVAEVVILATLDKKSRKVVKAILVKHGLEMSEAKGRVTIYEASQKSAIYL